jgi:hypothetical protein
VPLALRPGGSQEEGKRRGEGKRHSQTERHQSEGERRRLAAGGSSGEDVDQQTGAEQQRAHQYGQLYAHGAATLPPLDLAGQRLALCLYRLDLVRRVRPPPRIPVCYFTTRQPIVEWLGWKLTPTRDLLWEESRLPEKTRRELRGFRLGSYADFSPGFNLPFAGAC